LGFTHVLITRPERESRQLAARLEGLELAPVVIAPYRFEPMHPGPLLSSGWSHAGRRLAVFTSTRAVEYGLRQLPAGFLSEAEIAAIGPATAAALERAGLRVSLVPEGEFTSEGFLAHPDLSRAPGQALIFTAPGGRQLLQQRLGELGWQVEMVHVYQRKPVQPEAGQVAALQHAAGILSVWTSEYAMRVLSGTLPEAAWRAVCEGAGVVTSQRLREALEGLGVRDVHVSSGPDNDSILSLILDLI
jgi:uroporphyrinogen-III synthase